MNSFSLALNVFDNVIVFGSAQGFVCQSCEGNYWRVQAFNVGGNGHIVFQEVQNNDEIIDARIESGSSGNGTAGVCYSSSGQENLVRLVCDTGAAGWVALSDAPAAGSGNTYDLSLIGTATLGVLSARSTARVNAQTSSSFTVFGGGDFLSLGNPPNGAVSYCSNCRVANPCVAGGAGALAKRINGTWICN